MTIRLHLTLALDGGTADEIRAYGEQLVEVIRARQRTELPSYIEWRAGQLVDVHLDVDEQLPSIHGPEAVAASRHVMVDDDGSHYYPDNPEDAAEFAEAHGARYVHPDGGVW